MVNMVKGIDQNRPKQQELSRPNRGSTFYSLTILFLIAALLVDSLLSDVSSIVNRVLSEPMRIVLFSTILGIAILSGSYAILHYTKKVKSELGYKNNVLLLVSQIIPFIQYIIIGLLTLITLQIIFTLQYPILFLVALQALSWLTGVILMGIMSFKFIQWYRARRNLLVLLYLVSSLMFCGTLGATIIPQSSITIQSSAFYVNSHSTEVKPFQVNPERLSSMFAIISIANWLVLPLAFVIWAATAIMLNHYSKIIGRTKYWIILSIPLISLLAGTISWLFFIPSMNSIFDEQVILYTMLAFGGILAEGFLLSFAFILISKSAQVETNSKLKSYLSISAIGVAILFASFFANPSAGSYLPFGAIASSFFGFGVYLFFIGIYSSAISIASDIRLRQTIRKSLLDQSNLLDNIGLADINIELQKQTVDILRRHEKTMEEETGIESSISELEMKNYVKGVITELQKAREAKSSNKK
jgi:hypothetical protein